MCIGAGIQEKKTNHSLHATGATSMFAAQFPEKMTKDVTGHKSSKALALSMNELLWFRNKACYGPSWI